MCSIGTESSKTTRVAQVLGQMGSGGIEAVVTNYYKFTDKSEIQFDFYFDQTSPAPQLESLRAMGAGLYRIPSYTKVFAYQKSLQAAFRERKYEIVHVHLNAMSGFALFAAWRAGVPCRICHNHSTSHRSEGLRAMLKYVLRPMARKFANVFAACGELAARWLYGNRRVDRGEVYILPNAIDLARYAFSEDARERLRAETGISQGAFVVGYVGRITHQKNPFFLIDVFSEVLRRNAKSVLVILGEGEMEPEIRKYVEEREVLEKVFFLGTREDVWAWYSAMDAFCLPSFYEGVPLVAIEAQANGLPCALSGEVSLEAVLNENVQKVELREPAGVWAEKLLNGTRFEVLTSNLATWDIRKNANRLCELYRRFSREFEKREEDGRGERRV